MIELISMHIAKTGGLSFYEILKNEYGDKVDPRYKRVHFFPKKDYSDKLINRIPDDIKVLHGHLLYEHVREIHEQHNPKMVAWLRDPVDRVISNYYYLMKRVREVPDHPQKRKIAHTLIEYARDSIPNKMSHYMQGITLEELFFFGFLENFGEDVKTLAKMLNWKKTIPHVHLNRSEEGDADADCPTRRKDITGEMREEIAVINHQDMDLYRHALDLKMNQRDD